MHRRERTTLGSLRQRSWFLRCWQTPVKAVHVTTDSSHFCTETAWPQHRTLRLTHFLTDSPWNFPACSPSTHSKHASFKVLCSNNSTLRVDTSLASGFIYNRWLLSRPDEWKKWKKNQIKSLLTSLPSPAFFTRKTREGMTWQTTLQTCFGLVSSCFGTHHTFYVQWPFA